ncbi:iron-containing alcohol dehydrogenase, partial [Fusobacterium ulcerans]|uniref:iron-containing alcohol dehydrogenase n=1 Tax=Fusobacterium ulcerans TaxID=861 RepID=UPI002E7A5664
MEIFQATTEIFAGIGVGEVLKNLQSRKIIFITDSMMRKVGLAEKIENILKSMNIQYEIFDGVEVDPSLESIRKALDMVIDFSPEMIIALGGGSTLDSAKAAAYFMKNTGKEIPVLAVPTTCGTGSEVTSYAVITDRENNVKIPIKDDGMIPKIAVLDPEFTKTLPKVVVADGGIDALTHAIESYTCKSANLYTQIYAMEAIRGIFKNLLRMYSNIEDREARTEMGKASCIAGFAFEKSGLGINHSLAHAIGGKFHKSHGRSNGTI